MTKEKCWQVFSTLIDCLCLYVFVKYSLDWINKSGWYFVYACLCLIAAVIVGTRLMLQLMEKEWDASVIKYLYGI